MGYKNYHIVIYKHFHYNEKNIFVVFLFLNAVNLELEIISMSQVMENIGIASQLK